MSNHLPDEIAACKLITQRRREEREYARRTRKVKSITTQLEMIGGRQLSANVAISCNSETGTVLIHSSSLIFYKHRIHPSTHGKRTCGSEKALKMLDDARRYDREGSRRRRAEAKS